MTARRERGGFVMPSAVFLLLVLGALGVYILTVSNTQHIGQALDVEGERAYQAANAGMEWVRFRVAETSPPACPANTAWGASATSLTFAGTSTLASFRATVECASRSHTTVGGVETWVFEVRVTACNRPRASEPRCPGDNAGQPGYAERQMQGLLGM